MSVPVSVPGERLIGDIARRAAGSPSAQVVDWHLESFSYPTTNPSTISFERLHAVVADGHGRRSVSTFVKTIGSMRHSSILEFVPAHMREAAIAGFPWHVEADVYASRLLGDLPAGLRGPAVYAVEELPDDRSRLWIEDVTPIAADWDLGRYVQAARALGRLAARWSVEFIDAELPRRPPFLRSLMETRIRHSVIPMLLDEGMWTNSAVGGSVDDALCDGLLALWDDTPAILVALDSLPHSGSHGDACPQNLLTVQDGLVAIDWGMAGPQPIGFDLGQLLAGRAESRELAVHDLTAVHAAILPAYLDGMRAEGATPDPDAVRTGYVGSLLLRSAFTALPLELLLRPSDAELAPIFASRAGYARFLLGLRSEMPTAVA